MTFVASATASSLRSDDDAMSGASRRRNDKEIDAVPPPPFGLMGVAGDLCVARRRRCPCIAFSLLLDLASQDPSANVMVFLGRDTTPDYAQILYYSEETIRRAAPPARPASGYPCPPQRTAESTFAVADPKRVPSRVAQRTQVGVFVAS